MIDLIGPISPGLGLTRRMLRGTDRKALRNFVVNFGLKGMLSLQRFKRRLKHGEYFPPFLFISVINSCQLRCQGCWVDVASPRQMIDREAMGRLIRESQAQGNSYFGILGGEPFMHPQLLEILADHPDCYFQIFTNGMLIDDHVARELRRIGNATPLISVEGDALVSDERRGRSDVLAKTMAGIEASVRHKIVTGVATSVCKTNIDDMVDERWLRKLVRLGVHYAWFHTYRVIGPDPSPELALTPEEVRRVRRFIVKARRRLPIAIVEPYWDHEGKALCPMATGISHHVGPNGDLEPCPIIQFATGSIHDEGPLVEKFTRSDFIRDVREAAAGATRGCIVLERPDLLADVVERHGARDTTQRATALEELRKITPRQSQHQPGHEIPEEHWGYALAKRFWFNDFGAYAQGVS